MNEHYAGLECGGCGIMYYSINKCAYIRRFEVKNHAGLLCTIFGIIYVKVKRGLASVYVLGNKRVLDRCIV